MSEDKVWIYSDVYDLVLEILGKGRELADKLQSGLAAIIIGNNTQDKANEIIEYGADKVYLIDNPALRDFQNEKRPE